MRKHGRIWYVRIPAGRDPLTGRYGEREVSTGLTSQREAEKVRDQLLADASRGILPSTERTTVAEFLDRWMQDYVRPNLSPATIRSYDTEIRNHLAPALGSAMLRDLKPEHLARLYALKAQDGMAPAHVLYLHRILHKALNTAMKWGLVVRNVVDAVDAPKLRQEERPILTLDQAQDVLKHVRTDRLYSLYLIALEVGLREGELCARRWSDFDGKARSLKVSTKIQREKGKGLIEGPTKAKRPRSMAALSAMATNALLEHKRRQDAERRAAGSAWQGDWIWCWEDGRPYAPECISKHWRGVRAALNLSSEVRFHDLRHTSATLAIAAGEPLKVAQERLGHAKPATTLGMYGHATPEMHREAAETRAALFAPPSDPDARTKRGS